MFRDLGKCWYPEFEDVVANVIKAYKDAYNIDSNNFKYQQFLKTPNDNQKFLIDKVESICEVNISF